MSQFKTTTIEDTEMIYSLLRDKYPDRQIEIEFNDNTKEYFLKLTNEKYKEDPEVPVDIKIKIIYGDSVTEDTPLLLKKDNNIYIETIQSIFDESEKFEYPGFKMFDKTIRLEKEYCLSDYQIWSDIGWVDIKKVIRHKCEKKIYRVLTHTGCIDVTEDHSLLTENKEPIKPVDLKIGDSLLHSFPTEFTNKITFSIKNLERQVFDDKLSAQRAFYLFSSYGNNVYIKIEGDKFILEPKNNSETYSNDIINIECLSSKYDYVYDIETEIGRFGAGVGQLQTFNTDSVFLSLKYNRQDFNKNRSDSFNLATICGDNLTDQVFKRPPVEMEFEKVFQPFILLTKKRYIGKKYENMKDPFKLKEITKSGIAVSRRDFSKIVKNCYTEVIDCIVNEDGGGVNDSVEIYKSYVDRIDNYQIDIDDLITSKTLAKNYSCALCKKKTEWIHLKCDSCNKESPLGSLKCIKCKAIFKCIHKFNLVHVQLAIKMLNRKDEANINDRIQFVFIESDDRTLAKNELGEDPVYVKKNNLKYNRSFYLESLGKTILAFFKVCLNEHYDLLNDAIEYTNDKLESYGNKKLKPSDFKLDDN